jgi:ubiquinone/menaquinone biosynthesis C-methylase UbiE
MNDTPLQRAERTYSAAADHFDRPALGFWDRVGTGAAQRINLTAGQSVLDLCCGIGASALPAARAVRDRVIDGVRADRIQSVRTDVIHVSALR